MRHLNKKYWPCSFECKTHKDLFNLDLSDNGLKQPRDFLVISLAENIYRIHTRDKETMVAIKLGYKL